MLHHIVFILSILSYLPHFILLSYHILSYLFFYLPLSLYTYIYIYLSSCPALPCPVLSYLLLV